HTRALEDDEVEAPLHRLLLHKYRIDELYDAVIRTPIDKMSAFFQRIVETKVIDGLVNGTGKLSKWSGENLRTLQNGHLFAYILATLVGLIGLLAWIM
ncbi:MAG: NADH-quinone oxidoreductase subunit L, partial [Crocinitomicaceae bacterium]|nr:NADH-quinone oxidoreductase subunit L [Crocinitomicaceae bacterium]